MGVSTAARLGDITGHIAACVPIYLIGLLAGLLFKSREPHERATWAAIVAGGTAYVIAGFGFARAEGVAFSLIAGVLYVPATVIAFFLLRHHYRRLWRSDDPEVERIFE